MHELGLTKNIVDAILSHARQNNVQKIVRVVLEVGKISGVVPEALEFAFWVCIEGTLIEGAKLEIRQIAAIGKCKKCVKEFNLLEENFSCPICQESDWELISGKELNIKELEVI